MVLTVAVYKAGKLLDMCPQDNTSIMHDILDIFACHLHGSKVDLERFVVTTPTYTLGFDTGRQLRIYFSGTEKIPEEFKQIVGVSYEIGDIVFRVTPEEN